MGASLVPWRSFVPVLKPMKCPECGNTCLHRFHSCFHEYCSHEYWNCSACGHRKYKCPVCKEFASTMGGSACAACRGSVRQAG